MFRNKVYLTFAFLACLLPACSPREPLALQTTSVSQSSAQTLPPTALPTPSRLAPLPPAIDTPAAQDPLRIGEAIRAPSPAELNGFTLQLSGALEKRDFETLQTLLGAHFLLAEWQGDRQDLSPIQAEQALRAGPLAEGSRPAAFLEQNVAALLGGSDSLAQLDPKGSSVRAFAVSGLGSSAAGQAIVLVGFDVSKGKLFWRGLLVAPLGFSPTPSPANPTQTP